MVTTQLRSAEHVLSKKLPGLFASTQPIRLKKRHRATSLRAAFWVRNRKDKDVLTALLL